MWSTDSNGKSKGGCWSSSGGAAFQRSQNQKRWEGSRAALHALGGDRRKQTRTRIISAAHRSTLPPPLVLAKPVTAGPTPCGPSFTPAPIPNPPSSPSTLVILTPAPTPLPFPPPPTPTDGGPTPTKTPPSPYPSPCLSPTAPPPPYDPEEFPHGTKKKGVGQSIIWRVRK